MKKINLKNILKKTFKKKKVKKSIKTKTVKKKAVKKVLKKNKKKVVKVSAKPPKEKKVENLRIPKNNEVKPEIKKIKKQDSAKKEYKVKDYVVYPKHGVGQIFAISSKTIGGIEVQCYDIKFEKDKAIGLLPINKQNNLKLCKYSIVSFLKQLSLAI